ncbi:unnamed protein product [Staurois parvus]|uniref:Uncharacterized protein n=1 Tax=Staurois parvus TaxID=386267 RepID=A0ABN9FXQ7_9NEOB|nr:unnamed protein product [Staurois parvus]
MSCQSAPGWTDHWGTRTLPEGPGVSSWGLHEMSLVPFIGFFECGLSVDEDIGAP